MAGVLSRLTSAGNVFVAWHGNALDGPEGEQARRVWLARSSDDGAYVLAEVAISPAETGTCGCCGLRIAASGRNVHVLYRAATRMVHRDIYALQSSDAGQRSPRARSTSGKSAPAPCRA